MVMWEQRAPKKDAHGLQLSTRQVLPDGAANG